ncbi:MAG: DUF4382 domain-containing protein [Nitrososphaerota archaeon]|jgi:hypothetical protein|nr:DUF4382 domain-containing protein [Nitrososphaerota archaeon]MDG6930103.1 DUF4382 domain-containing protein [Nitrososphaerota archaeon]
MNSKILAIAIAAIIAAGGASYAYLYLPMTAPTGSASTFSVLLTDPPSVPSGTQAVNVNFSEVAIQINNGSWLYSSVNQQINLMHLLNVSKVVAVFKVPENSTVTQIRFYVSNATLVISGSKYALFVPSGVIKVPVTNYTKMTGVLVDLHTHIVESHAGRSIRYILTPVVSIMPLNKQPGHNLQTSLLTTYLEAARQI